MFDDKWNHNNWSFDEEKSVKDTDILKALKAFNHKS